MKKFLLLLFSLYLALVFLMPKVELWYTLKHYLQPQRIVLTQKSVKDMLWALKIEDMTLLYDGIESARAEKVTVIPWLFYNAVKVENLSAGKDVRKMFDFKAENLDLTYSVVSPFRVNVEAEGNFGTIHGALFLKTGRLKLVCEPTPRFKSSTMFREMFRKTDEGYVHESSIR